MDGLFNQALYYAFHPFFCMLYGLLFHFLTKVAGAINHGSSGRPCLTDYWMKHPIQSGMSLLGAFIGYATLAHFPEFEHMAPDVQNTIRVAAVGVGFMGDRVVDAIGRRTERKIEGGV
jgi:hypothetical protein